MSVRKNTNRWRNTSKYKYTYTCPYCGDARFSTTCHKPGGTIKCKTCGSHAVFMKDPIVRVVRPGVSIVWQPGAPISKPIKSYACSVCKRLVHCRQGNGKKRNWESDMELYPWRHGTNGKICEGCTHPAIEIDVNPISGIPVEKIDAEHSKTCRY